MNRAIIIGSTSGIGRALGERLVSSGWKVGFTGRRVSLLQDLLAEHPGAVFAETLDVTVPGKVEAVISGLVQRMGGCDLIVVSAGVGHINAALTPEPELATIDVNVSGFTRAAVAAMQVFMSQGHGHLVIISSIAGNRGDSAAPAYGATKAYQTIYAQALRKKAAKTGGDITVTEVQPGFVDTDMAQGGVFWLQPVEKAARQIEEAINKKRAKAYVTRRWRLVAWVMRNLPSRLWHRV